MKRAFVFSLGLLLSLGDGLGDGLGGGGGARAQQLDMTRGGPVEITASDGLEWHQNEQQVVARGNARAVRGNVTVTADRLIAYYRKKNSPPAGTGAQPAAAAPGTAAPGTAATGTAATGAAPSGPSPGPSPGPSGASGRPGRARNPQAGTPPAQPGLFGGGDSGSNEIYRVEAIGNVHIYTATDHVVGARAIYDMDQAVMLMTGGNLKLTTPTQVLTARDSLEYWTQRRMAVARGNAVVVTNDAKRVAADTLVAFTKEDGAAPPTAPRAAPRTAPGTAPGTATPAPAPAPARPGVPQQAGSGKLQRVEAFGNVSIQTPTEVVTGDRAIYVADSGLARLGGNVRITRGQNQLNGADAEVNMNTGVSRLLAGSTGRVSGLVIPNDPSNQSAPDAVQPGANVATPQTPPARRRATAPGSQTGTQP